MLTRIKQLYNSVKYTLKNLVGLIWQGEEINKDLKFEKLREAVNMLRINDQAIIKNLLFKDTTRYNVVDINYPAYILVELEALEIGNANTVTFSCYGLWVKDKAGLLALIKETYHAFIERYNSERFMITDIRVQHLRYKKFYEKK